MNQLYVGYVPYSIKNWDNSGGIYFESRSTCDLHTWVTWTQLACIRGVYQAAEYRTVREGNGTDDLYRVEKNNRSWYTNGIGFQWVIGTHQRGYLG